VARTYSLYRASQPGGPFSLVVSGLTTPAYAGTGEPSGRIVYYYVTATENGQDSAPSATAAVAMIDPTALTATGGTGVNHIRLSWTPVSCAASYRVWRLNPDIGAFVRMAETSALSFDDYATENDVRYQYIVTALGTASSGPDVAESSPSNVAAATLSQGGIYSMARAFVYQGIQVGRETTPGLLVPATIRLKNMEMQPKQIIPKKGVRHSGSKAYTDGQVGHEHTEASFTGAMDFNLLYLVLSSLFGDVAPTTVGVAGRQRLWKPSPVQPGVQSTLTFEQGSARGAEKFGWGFVGGCHLTWTPEDASMDGQIFGTRLQRNITMTTPLPVLPPLAVSPVALSVWLSTDGGVTFNQLNKTLDGEIRLLSLWKPVFHVTDATSSYDDTVELAPDFGAKITTEEGTEADLYMARLYDNQVVHLGLKATGPMIEAGTPNIYHQFKAQLPVRVMTPDPGNKNDVYGNTFTFDIADDENFGLGQFSLINKISTL